MTGLEIRPLTVELWPKLAELFAVGGDSRWCWCTFWRRRGEGGGRDAAAQNEALLRDLAEQPDRNVALGLLAFEGERAVGWLSLGPREEFPRLEHSRLLAPVDEEPVWSIVCFVVAKSERGRGIARTLLEAGIDYARENGAERLEAYPVDPDGQRVPGAYAYLGTRKLFESAGFKVVATRQAAGAKRARRVMRLDL
jgi:GNAT superfamily N-acetyltransferase